MDFVMMLLGFLTGYEHEAELHPEIRKGWNL
jgi:hypothetical protein